MHIKFLPENLKREDHVRYPDMDRKIILKCVLKKGCKALGKAWIYGP
jgi:hypothetical protein